MPYKKKDTTDAASPPKQVWIPAVQPQKATWTKPGFKSTEFWGVIAITIMQITKVVALPPWAAPVALGLYTVARGLAKSGGPEITE